MRRLPKKLRWALMDLRWRLLLAGDRSAWTVVDCAQYKRNHAHEFMMFGLDKRPHIPPTEHTEESAERILELLTLKPGMWKWDHITGAITVEDHAPPHLRFILRVLKPLRI